MSSYHGPYHPQPRYPRREALPQETRENSLTNPMRGLFRMDPQEANQEHNIDIVAVHGLGEDWEDTWKDRNGMVWLRDFLPAALPNARIYSYGYDAGQVFVEKGKLGLTQEATRLLEELKSNRQGAVKTRPIVFISHSLGGVLVKKAIVVAHDSPSLHGDLFSSLRGFIFFGVPHRARSPEYWAAYMTDLMNYAQIGFGTNIDFVKAIQNCTAEIETIALSFVPCVANILIRTFFETLTMGNPLLVGSHFIVDPDSTRLYLPNEVALGMVNANHRNLCKFSSAESQNYILVMHALVRMARSAI